MSSIDLQVEILQRIIFNTLFLSIPEEFFLVMFAYILAGEFDYWEEPEYKKLINKWDYARVFVPTVVAALLSNIMRYTGHDLVFIGLLPCIVMYILMILTNRELLDDHGSAKWAGKVLLFLLLGYLVVCVSEFSYYPIFLYVTGRTVTEINNNILFNFALSVPARVIEYLILIFFVVRKRTLLRANLLIPIFESKVSKFLTFTMVVCDFAFMIIMCKAIVYERILRSLPVGSQVIIILGVVLFPIVNIAALVYGLYNIKNREVQKQKEISEEIVKLLNELKMYTESENYDNIRWKLNEMGMNMEKIAESLYESKAG